jgi:hypothetical protein
MPALVAGIHAFLVWTNRSNAWMPGMKPGMTALLIGDLYVARHLTPA